MKDDDRRELERIERKSVRRRHETTTELPDDADGETGDVKFLERNDNDHNRITKYPSGWKKQLGGTDFLVDKDGSPYLAVTVGGRRYRIQFTEET